MADLPELSPDEAPPARRGNLLRAFATVGDAEQFEPLLAGPGFRLERIVSHGHRSPPDFWYDQPDDEWVVLLSGSARLAIQGEAVPHELGPGDWILLPAHRRHRVEWTDPGRPTVWLALHREPPENPR